MDPLSAGLVSGGVSSAFGVFNNERNIGLAKDVNAQQIALAREQMAFQERMSNSAHQREADDMEKAGLNRILSATRGGASAPAGATPTLKAPESHLDSVMRDSINSGVAVYNAQADVNLKQSQSAANLASALNQTESAKAQAVATDQNRLNLERSRKTFHPEVQKAYGEADRTREQARTQKVLTDREALQRTLERADQRRALEEIGINQGTVKYDTYMQKILNAIQGITSGFSLFKLYQKQMGGRDLPSNSTGTRTYENRKGRLK